MTTPANPADASREPVRPANLHEWRGDADDKHLRTLAAFAGGPAGGWPDDNVLYRAAFHIHARDAEVAALTARVAELERDSDIYRLAVDVSDSTNRKLISERDRLQAELTAAERHELTSLGERDLAVQRAEGLEKQLVELRAAIHEYSIYTRGHGAAPFGATKDEAALLAPKEMP